MSGVGVGDIVSVDTWKGVWKVLAVADGKAHLTRCAADPRQDLQGVEVGRLTAAEVLS